MTEYVLTGDIGGTNANFAVVRLPKPKIVLIRHYSTQGAKGFVELVNRFLHEAGEHGYKPRGASLAAAGPVISIGQRRYVRLTKAKLVVGPDEIVRKTKLRKVVLMNDFIAISYAVNALSRSDFAVVRKGSLEKNGTIAVIGPGTGLGVSIVPWVQAISAYVPIGSEMGHTNLPVVSQDEMEFSAFATRTLGRSDGVETDDVATGPGLELIYRYLQKTSYHSAPRNLKAEEIANTRKMNPCSRETFRLFERYLARASRNLCLSAMATGGLYVAGGIVMKNPEVLSKDFIRLFNTHDIYNQILKRIPIYRFCNYDISHIGAAVGYSMMGRR
jgi:glucokinase